MKREKLFAGHFNFFRSFSFKKKVSPIEEECFEFFRSHLNKIGVNTVNQLNDVDAMILLNGAPFFAD